MDVAIYSAHIISNCTFKTIIRSEISVIIKHLTGYQNRLKVIDYTNVLNTPMIGILQIALCSAKQIKQLMK